MAAKSDSKPLPKSTPNGSNASLQTRVTRMRLADLTLLEKNARFMRSATFARLVENIRADGCLTSVPLVSRVDGKLLVASGNHRVPAAIKAGIEEADVMEILTPLTREQFVALQLAHNAVVGEDDPNILQSLYAELSFGWKEYSGLTDDAFKVEDLDTTMLRVGSPFYEELQIFFLPADAAIVTDLLGNIAKSKAAITRLVGAYADFDLFFQKLLAVKHTSGVHNTAVALRMMAELAAEALARREEAAAAVEADART